MLAKSDYANVSIEAELGVTLSRDVVPGMSIDETAASVDAVYPLLELHNLVMRGEAPNGHELVCNNCIHSGVVRGAPVTDLHGARQTDLKLVYDGSVVDEWASVSWSGDLLAALDWLAGNLEARGVVLKAGDLVLIIRRDAIVRIRQRQCYLQLMSRPSVDEVCLGTLPARLLGPLWDNAIRRKL